MDINHSDASDILGVTRATIYAMQKRGELSKPVTASSIMAYVQSRKEEMQAELRVIESRLLKYMQEEVENDKLAVLDWLHLLRRFLHYGDFICRVARLAG